MSTPDRNLKLCNACSRPRERSGYSATAWKKKGQRRCTECTENNIRPRSAALPPGYHVTVNNVTGNSSAEYSTTAAVEGKSATAASSGKEYHVTFNSEKGDSFNLTLNVEQLQALRDKAKSVVSTTIDEASGVDWAGQELPARMKAMQKRHDAVLSLSENGGLTLHKIKEYHDWLANLSTDIADEGANMERKYRLTTAKQCRSHDQRRALIHQKQAELIKKNGSRHNKEVTMVKFEVNWLKESPAWKKAMEFLQEHWVKTAKGDWVSKRDLEDDMSTSFDDLLASMKEEDT